MDLMIIGVALTGLGLVGAAVTSRGRHVRIAASCIGALGVGLLVVSWVARNPPNYAKRVRSKCEVAAIRLEFYDKRRTSSEWSWTREEAKIYWDGMDDFVDLIADICIEDSTSCNGPITTNPMLKTFPADLATLTDAIRTGKPCGR